jgi:hypothetical protein
MKPETKNQLKRAGVIAAGSFVLTLAGVVFLAVASTLVHLGAFLDSLLF